MLGVHDFRASGGDTFKLALYTSAADLNANTTSYTASNEASGTNYPAGGIALTNVGVTTTNETIADGTGFVDFADAVFANVTVTARGALIYNSTPSATDNNGATLTNPAVAVLDFGSDKSASDGQFTVVFPTSTNTSAIIRVT